MQLRQGTRGRLVKQLRELKDFVQPPTIRVSKFQGDICHWKSYIEGPQDSPYQGGIFQIDVKITKDYPLRSPLMKFETTIWHPNICQKTGEICLDILQNQSSPALTIEKYLLSIQSVLYAPEIDDPKNLAAAEEYNSNRKSFLEHAQQYTKKYASPQIYQAKIMQLTQMGFPKYQVIEALQKYWI